jgi:hypothetical protein
MLYYYIQLFMDFEDMAIFWDWALRTRSRNEFSLACANMQLTSNFKFIPLINSYHRITIASTGPNSFGHYFSSIALSCKGLIRFGSSKYFES